ncbi:uncharacterized protein LOC106773651 isoform X2 [Vigna radiata var. radiata]|uniref:Uncharacterized protein LOC106773651 isoform X2 n=1 Tax=Vigna radiata var. radiata TaxID=3916 RepID=A0A1S3VCC4_VIGRR|nr:uncharacterized protein LOC106773651 isoform X2 [Vigna radiata var. radiata]
MRSRQGEEENLNLRGSNGRENLKGETGFQGFIQRGFPALGNCVEIDIPMLLLIVGLSQVHVTISYPMGSTHFFCCSFICNDVCSFVSMESTGAYKAASRLAIATPPPAYVLS